MQKNFLISVTLCIGLFAGIETAFATCPPENAPILVAPPNASVAPGEAVQFWWYHPQWNGYLFDIYIARDAGFNDIVFYLFNVDVVYNPPNIGLLVYDYLPNDGSRLYWKINVHCDWRYGDPTPRSSQTWWFNNGYSGPPDPPDLNSPYDRTTVNGTQVSFSWNAAPQASNYHIQISANTSFTNLVYDSAIGNYTGINLYGFPDNGNEFYWRVRAGNSLGWSGWSDIWRFTNGPSSPPPIPDLNSPYDRTTVNGTQVSFTWDTAPRANNYHIQISANTSFTNLIYDSAIGNYTGINISGFPDNGNEFYWRVRAGNPLGWSGWSDIWRFTNGPSAPPPIPDLNSPYDRTTVNGTQVSFSWNQAPRANNYHIQISANTSFTNLIYDSAIGNYTGININGFPDNGNEFYWRVRAGNPLGWSGWSDIWRFTNGSLDLPVPPILIYPENGAHMGGTTILFEWNSVADANNYYIQISRNSTFTNLIYDEQLGGNYIGIVLHNFPNQGTQYWWRVRAGNQLGWGDWSFAFTFINADSIPHAPILIAPANGLNIGGSSINFEWSASSGANNYRLQISRNNTFTNLFYNQEVGNETNVTVRGFGMQNTLRYWWRVQAGNILGWSGWSNVSTFTNSGNYVEGHVSGKIFLNDGNDTLTAKAFRSESIALIDYNGNQRNITDTDLTGYYFFNDTGAELRFELIGPFARAGNYQTNSAVVTSPFSDTVNYTWDYNSSNTHLDEVNVFYHVNLIHDYFKQALGYTEPNRYQGNGMDYPMFVTVHNLDSENAFYSPGTQGLYFGDGAGSSIVRDTARARDAIYHEYTHGVVDHIYVLPYQLQPGAMNEGLADYFSASVTKDPIIGEWVFISPSDWRNLDQSAHEMRFDNQGIRNSISDPIPSADYWILSAGVFPSQYNDWGWVHHNSLIYSGALWDLRQSIGSAIPDNVIFEHLFRTPLDFLDSLNKMLMTDDDPALGFGGDNNLTNGTPHELQIRNSFGKHGIYNDDDTFEDNDSSNSATPIPAGNYPNLRCYDDDWYKIHLVRGDGINITINFVNAYGNLDLYLYDPNLSQIDSSTTNVNTEVVSATAAVDGYYYVKVSGHTAGDVNRYNMVVKVCPSGTPNSC